MSRRWIAPALVALGIAAGGCGEADGGQAKGPPGSPSNPVRATSAPDVESNASSAGARTPGYKGIVDAQSSKPRSRFTPCNLVSPAEAKSILGGPIRAPLEARQGPTCIYQSRKGRGYVTVAVQNADIRKLAPQLSQRRRVEASGRSGWCGHYGQEMLYLPVSGGRVLSIAAPCPVAAKFAAKAMRQLTS